MNYLSISEPVRAELIIKKSKFIAFLLPAHDLNDIENTLKTVRCQYPGANHYCYAYIIRQEGMLLERCSDDGEPSGTAGWPILNVIKNRKLHNILAVVVRYFGGTLLGTGGLVKAYTQSLQSALDIAQLVKMEYSQKLIATLDYSNYGGFQKQFAEIMSRVDNVQFSDKVHIEVWIAIEDVPSFASRLDNLSGGTAVIEQLEKGFIPKEMKP
ncbi:MAG: YigZ family protein [Syntrophomonas sp.]